ncbi:MAG TPA: class I SAM-dependent methyltransferase [Pirellulales bacterium]
MQKHLIISRFNEDPGWLSRVNGCDKIWIYDKSEEPLPGSIPLPNTGRDVGVILTHIVRHYQELPEWLLFAQCNPFDHTINFLDVANAATYNDALAHNRSCYTNNKLAADGFLGLGNQFDIYRGLIYLDERSANDDAWRTFHEDKHDRLFDLWSRLWPDHPAPTVWPSAYGCQILVSRERIREWPLELYRELLRAVSESTTIVYALENLWWRLWGPPPAPAPRCIDGRMAHFYQDIPGFFDFADVYREQVWRAHDGAHFVEIGCWMGRSAAFLAVEIVNSHKRIKLDLVDTFSGRLDKQDGVAPHVMSLMRRDFDANLAPIIDKVRVRQMPSVLAAATYPDASVDFAFIDAAHDYESVKADISAWLPKIKVGGTLAGHDFNQDRGEVSRVVQEAFEDRFIVSGQTWLVQL